MLSSVSEAVVTNPPHVVNVICDLSAFRRLAVAFNDNLTFTRVRNLERRHVYARRETLIAG